MVVCLKIRARMTVGVKLITSGGNVICLDGFLIS